MPFSHKQPNPWIILLTEAHPYTFSTPVLTGAGMISSSTCAEDAEVDVSPPVVAPSGGMLLQRTAHLTGIFLPFN